MAGSSQRQNSRRQGGNAIGSEPVDPHVVPAHAHAADDVQGLPQFLFPPSVVADGVEVDPTTSGGTWGLLDDMEVDVVVPAGGVWDCELWFDGQFFGTDVTVGVRLARNPSGGAVVLDNTTRTQALTTDAPQTVVSKTIVRGLRAGSYTFGVQWQGTGGGGDVTADDTLRHVTATLSPSSPIGGP